MEKPHLYRKVRVRPTYTHVNSPALTNLLIIKYSGQIINQNQKQPQSLRKDSLRNFQKDAFLKLYIPDLLQNDIH